MTKKFIFRIVAVVIIVMTIFLIAHEANAPEQTPMTDQISALPPAHVPTVDPESIGKIIKEPVSGKEFISNQLIVEFQSSISEGDALAIIASLNGKMIQRFTAAPLFLIEIKDSGDGSITRAAVTKFRANVNVKNAELNYLTTIDQETL